jgi:hypothetical protein
VPHDQRRRTSHEGRGDASSNFNAIFMVQAPGPSGAIEQRELAAEALQHHFGRIAVLAGLILPLARMAGGTSAPTSLANRLGATFLVPLCTS